MKKYNEIYLVVAIPAKKSQEPYPVYGTNTLDQAMDYLGKRVRSSLGRDVGYTIQKVQCALQIDVAQDTLYKECEKEVEFLRVSLMARDAEMNETRILFDRTIKQLDKYIEKFGELKEYDR